VYRGGKKFIERHKNTLISDDATTLRNTTSRFQQKQLERKEWWDNIPERKTPVTESEINDYGENSYKSGNKLYTLYWGESRHFIWVQERIFTKSVNILGSIIYDFDYTLTKKSKFEDLKSALSYLNEQLVG